jgi:hypothetical protein
MLCFVLAALPAAATAQELSFFAKMELKQACEKDIETLCGSVERGEGRLLQCVRESADMLSQPCHDAVAKLRGELLAAADEPMDY